MHVRLETLKPAQIAYLRHLGPYGEPVGRFWRDTVDPWIAENALAGATRYGLSHDDPSISAAAKCRYDACLEADEATLLSGSPCRTTLPGGRYAIVDCVGAANLIGAAWSRLLRGWLPGSGLQLDGGPCFERYPADGGVAVGDGDFRCEICVPVAPL